MSDRRWIRVTAVDNIPPREGRAVLVGDRGAVVRPTHGRDHCVGTYQTKVDDGVVSVLLPAAQAQVEAA